MLPPAHVDPRPRLLIIGCSTRAAAWSAVRAGFRPVCADQFGDEDLRQVAESAPDLLLDFQSPWGITPKSVAAAHIYVSDRELQNLYADYYLRPDKASRVPHYFGPRLSLSAFDVLGIAGPKIVAILRLSELPRLRSAAEVVPRTIRPDVDTTRETPPGDGTWMLKPIHGGGGNGVRVWDGKWQPDELHRMSYFQQRVEGTPMSAMFLASPDGIELLGITQQLIGDAVASSPWPFGYCGTIGPTTLPHPAVELLQQSAAAIAKLAALKGLFGFDFVWDGTTPWIVEVNPRYTASCEILELAQQQTLLTRQWECFVGDRDPAPPPLPPEPRHGATPAMIGKLILFARQPCDAPDLSRFVAARSPWTVPYLADIPRIGTRFEPGEPMCTVFAGGDDVHAVRRKLYRRAERVRRSFENCQG